MHSNSACLGGLLNQSSWACVLFAARSGRAHDAVLAVLALKPEMAVLADSGASSFARVPLHQLTYMLRMVGIATCLHMAHLGSSCPLPEANCLTCCRQGGERR